ncbi:MAG: RNA polymerase sigma factor [Acidimicrobiales bacterium]
MTERPPRRSDARATTAHGHADGPSDEALLAGIAAGDEGSTVAFVRRYQRRVYGLAVGVLNDHAAAEDVAQEALLRAWRHAPVFDPRRGTVESWVLTITKNLSIDALRRRRDLATDPDELVNGALAFGGPSVEETVSTRSLRPQILRALRELPVEQRRAVVLASLYARTAAEISELESIPLGTAKTRIRTGLLKLRSIMDTDEARSA